MQKITPTLSFHRQHPLSRRSAAFQSNRRHASRMSHMITHASGQPEPTPRIAQLALILLAIFITSCCAALGMFPELAGEPPAPAAGTTFGADKTLKFELSESLQKLALPAQFAKIEDATASSTIKAEILNALGVTYLAKADSKNAIACFQKAIANDPTLIAANNNLGAAMLNAGNSDAAKTAFEATLKLQPTNAYATHQLQRLSDSK